MSSNGFNSLFGAKPFLPITNPGWSPAPLADEEPPGREFGDVKATRTAIYDDVQKAVSSLPPLQNQQYTLKVSDVKYRDPDYFPIHRQKQAVLRGETLTRRLTGNWELIDNATNKVVDSKRGTTVANVPFLTDRGTFIFNGSEYTLRNQKRLRSGVFTRVKQNDEVEAQVNALPRQGVSHRLFLDPETGVFKIKVGQANIPLLSLLRVMGATDQQVRAAWGNELTVPNERASNEKRDLGRLYTSLVAYGRAADDDGRKQAVRTLMESTGLDPEVTRRTLGKPYERVSTEQILRTTRKLLAVANRNNPEFLKKLDMQPEDPDDRDSLAFMNIIGPEDLISERVPKSTALYRKLLWDVTNRRSLRSLPSGVLDKALHAAILSSGLGTPAEAVNPAEIFAAQAAVTRMGVGGIGSDQQITLDNRNVQPSHLGFVDILYTPESSRAGVDLRLSQAARKGRDGKIYAQVRDLRTGRKVWQTPADLLDHVVAFPGELKYAAEAGRRYIGVLDHGKMRMAPIHSAEFELPAMETAFSSMTNLVFGKRGTKGQRGTMGARMTTQALPLVNPETPLVQMYAPDSDETYQQRYGRHMGAVKADQDGTVQSVKPDSITLAFDDGTSKTIDLYHHFPSNRKTGWHQTPLVQKGDRVKAGALIAKSNYTNDRGEAALGLNARVMYIPYKGLDFEDAVVISDSMAKRLTSEHYYQFPQRVQPEDRIKKEAFNSFFPGAYPKTSMDKLGDDGVVRVGQTVMAGDPLVLTARNREGGKIVVHKGRKAAYVDDSLLWQHRHPGVVTDVEWSKTGPLVVVRSIAEMQVGDKLSGTYGDKGVVSAIVPDHQMPQDAEGQPAEVIVNPLGIISRTNPIQVIEAVLGKIAAKTGQPARLRNVDDIDDLVEYAERELEKHGMSDTETVLDPETGRRIPNVFVGNRFYMKLHHQAEGKAQGRGFGDYTVDEAPAKGGDEGAKRVGFLETVALLSHGATHVVRDASVIRGQKNQEYWSRVMSGFPPPSPRTPFVYEKFIAQLAAAGAHPIRDGNRLHIMPLTDKGIDELTEGRELRNVETVDWRNRLQPVPGGLFDERLTGGHAGRRWSFIKLHEPVPNPVMEEPILKLLHLTGPRFRNILIGKDELNGKTGPEAIHAALKAIDVDKAIEVARQRIATTRGANRSSAIKQLGYLKAAKANNTHPGDWMWTKVPVLPPAFRQVSEMAGSGLPMVADANFLYKAVWDSNRALKDLSGVSSDVADERATLYDSVKAVVGLGDPTSVKLREKQVKGILRHVFGASPKYGVLVRRLLSSTTDLVGRAAITPDPELDIDHVGLPEDKAWSIYKPFIIRRLVRQGVPRLRAATFVDARDKVAREELLAEMAERPVLINRAPTLHRWGVMAAWPRLTAGDTLKISPLVVGGYGADFDGDQQINHVVVAILDPKDGQPDNMLLRRALPTVSRNHHLRVVNLEDFPHGEYLQTTQGQYGPIDWYQVPAGTLVLSHCPEGAIDWRPVTVWSVHRGCPVEIVTLRSGRQIVTDNDPRAVYGVPCGSVTLQRTTPQDAVARKFLVPRTKYLDLDQAADLTELPTAAHHSTTKRTFKLRASVPLTAELGYFIGAMIGNGWASDRAVCFSDDTDAVVEKLEVGLRQLFDGAVPASGCVEMPGQHYGYSRRFTYTSVALARWLAPLIGLGAANKHLPPWWYRAPREFREGLWAGLMDTDGAITVVKAAAKNKQQLQANYCSNSLRLVQEVQLLGMSLGVSGRITASKTPTKQDHWVISFSNYDIARLGPGQMVHPDKLARLASIDVQMTPALARHDLVPITADLGRALRQQIPTKSKCYSGLGDAILTGYITRSTAQAVIAAVRDFAVVRQHPDFAQWWQFVETEAITWDPVESYEVTGIAETGYDLTVPGSETFMAVDGVVLSNTMQFHVPASAAAVNDAIEKMMPSKNLIAVKDFKSPMFSTSQEYTGGLYAASVKQNANKRPAAFATAQDAIKAFRRGEIDIDQMVEIPSR